MPVVLTSKPPGYWLLHLAIAAASNDSREAPWYGPWNIVLQDLFHAFGPQEFFTVTYLQFPLVKEIDTVDSDEEESDEGSDYEAGLYPLLPIKYLLINSTLVGGKISAIRRT
jgi:hypothetical protein